MSKNLTFKLIMDGDSKGLVAAAKQSEQVVSKVFEAIKQEANQTRLATNNATQGIDQLGKESTTAAVEVKKLDSELANTNVELSKTNAVSNEATKGIEGLKTGYTALTSAMAALGIGASATEIARTADEFKVLEARIGLVTSKSGNFTQAFEGVKKIAIETRSNLTATAELFTRVKTATDQLGYSQERALNLTDLVNKSLIVGGGLAASNEAAIYQFNQALQSGVLRGEEFNSVMEQAPRLARALADGLDVNIGKLRAMAGEGKLTSEVIVKALESQSKALNAEFGKMPVTIGQSIENLKTAWTLYIGEADSATGASERVANAIKLVSENLDQIVSTLILAGQAFIAYKALNIANVFLDKAAGVKAAQVAITQETASVVANTQAQLANAAATRSAAAAKTQLATNTTVAATTATTASGSVMTLISRLGALGVAVTAVGVLIPTVFMPVGTAIGEGVAKGVERATIAFDNLEKSANGVKLKYTDTISASEKLEFQLANEEAQTKAVAEVKKSFADAADKARDKTYQLTEESKKLVIEFDELIKKGAPTKEALDKISGAMKFDSTKGINDAVTTLNLLREQGKITAEQMQAELAKALSGKDLIVFQTNAKAAFAGTSQEAAKSAAVTEAVMKAALGRTGLETQQLKGAFSSTFQSANNDIQVIIGSLEAYKAQGIDTGLALSANLNNAIDTAQTGAELDYAKGKLVEYGKQGLITGEQVALGLSKIEQKIGQLPDILNPAQAAFNAMGVKTQEQLDSVAQSAQANFDVISKSGQATADGIQQAYKLMLDSTIATGDKAKIAVAQAKAASLGLQVQLDATGKATVSKLGEIQQAAVATQRTVSQVSQSSATSSQPEISPEQQATNDHWDDFKAKMKARTDELNAKSQARGSGGGNASLLSNSGDSTQQISAVPDAPLIATSLDIQPMEGMETKETVEIKIDMGTGQTATVSAAPDQATALEEMMRELEAIKGRS
ncbi:tape measure protein [Acinetobacter johnsonii]|uniref:Tape measure domain-containing protein n=1 Tax=Acinetobacter johnsonii TaxID=40214 RepID=A0A3R9G8M3_ACIJO|nr:tape measure protein [Acinetobacter johnsonii]RSE25144.1 tape measure domain-containing protein [Acinetobacter johnsonii]